MSSKKINVMTSAIEDLKVRLRLAYVHPAVYLRLSNDTLEVAAQLILEIERRTQIHLHKKTRDSQYLYQWQDVYLRKNPPPADLRWAHCVVIVRAPLAVYQYDATGAPKRIHGSGLDHYLCQVIEYFPRSNPFDPINRKWYAHDNNGLNVLNAWLVAQGGQSLRRDAQVEYLPPPQLAESLQLEHAFLGDKALSVVIEESLNVLQPLPDDAARARHFLAAVILSLKSIYGHDGLPLDNNLATILTELFPHRPGCDAKAIHQAELALLAATKFLKRDTTADDWSDTESECGEAFDLVTKSTSLDRSISTASCHSDDSDLQFSPLSTVKTPAVSSLSQLYRAGCHFFGKHFHASNKVYAAPVVPHDSYHRSVPPCHKLSGHKPLHGHNGHSIHPTPAPRIRH